MDASSKSNDARASKFAPIAAHIATFLVGTTLALIAAQLISVWAAICGSSSESWTAFCVATAVAFVFELRLSDVTASNALIRGGLLLIIGCLSWMQASALNWLLTLGASVSETVPLICFVPSAVFAGITTFVALHWSSSFLSIRRTSHIDRRLLAIGIAVGFILVCVHGLTLLPAVIPIFATGLIATACSLTTSESTASDRSIEESDLHIWLLPWPQVTSAIGFGIFLVGCGSFTTALMPVTLPLLFLTVAVLVLLLSISEIAVLRNWLTGPRQLAALLLIPALIPLSFDTLTGLNLQLTASTDSVLKLFLARSLQFATFCATGGIAWMAVNRIQGAAAMSRISLAFISVGVTLGCCIAATGCFPGVMLATGILTIAAGITVRMNASADPFDEPMAARKSFRPAVLAAVTAAVLTTIIPYDPARATQLLFSSRAFQGFRAGLDSEMIVQSTAFRLLDEQRTSEGHFTAWNTSGDQVQLRRDGIPIGQVSTNTHTTPQPISDTLPTLLPLVMHRNASSVLLIGDETGEGLRVCSDFPVHTVVATRQDAGTTRFARKHVWQSMETPPFEDERFTIVDEPISVSIRRPRDPADRFDAVVAVSPNPTTVPSLEQLTPEFYAAVRSQLTDEGVFCQRITRHDVGAVPLVRMISAVSRHFGRVAMLHMAAGEIALIASVQPDGLLDAGLLKRLQRDHVARVLSRSGWDWSQLAALPVIDTNDPVGVFEHQEQLASATAGNMHFAFALPLDAASWSDKAAELRTMFAPHQQRLADAAQRTPLDYQEFARRFSAVVQQNEILSSFPDQPWPYRRSLRMEMQRNTRPPVERNINGTMEKTADPRDEYRKQYFISLGQALQQAKAGPVDPLSLRKLASFTARYEPLLSHFAHHELIRIHEATGHPSPALEFRHRLHTIYFTEGTDFSVRQLVKTLEQLLDDPDLIADATDRFDHVNSMLQELVRRWELRRNYDPPSARQTQADVDKCISVAKRGLDALFEWAPEVGIAASEITARRRFINRALVSPLRSYHETVLAHRIKNEAPIQKNGNDLPLLIGPGGRAYRLMMRIVPN